ncbi:MAG: YbaL family putative K(+) efflux transporter [Steroidobacteraceae bacterium]
MHHQTELIALIAVGFVLALIFGMLAHRLKLPPLVGYLLAGVFIGPFTPGFVADSNLAQQLSEVGVILLMFGVGLHFSLATLWQQRAIALPGAIVQIAVATAIGALAAHSWGWTLEAGLVLGLALSVASTVVLLRALEQRNDLNTDRGHIAVGWLIVEDLVTVLALVFLPALAHDAEGGASGNLWREAGVILVKVSLFLAVMLLGGRRVVPWVLGRVAKTGSRELFTLTVLAIAMGIAYGSAVLFDVSFALGAFFAGVMLAESDLSHEAAEKSLPLQDAFAVLFFVSVGMLFDPTILVRDPLAVLTVLFVIVVGKSIAAFAIVLMFAHPVRTALTISASLAQIGEFSFILAALGVSLGLMPEEGRDLILAGALLSITLNPFVFATIAPVERWLERSPRLLRAITRNKEVHVSGPDVLAELSNHAIIVGYGRVGSVIGKALAEQNIPFAVIERNGRVYQRHLSVAGIPAVAGDAAAEGVLASAGIERARLIVVASPDGFYARRVLELAMAANPTVRAVVRTHHVDERDRLLASGATHAVMGEHELAIAMSRYTLQEWGVDAEATREATARLRLSTNGRA